MKAAPTAAGVLSTLSYREVPESLWTTWTELARNFTTSTVASKSPIPPAIRVRFPTIEDQMQTIYITIPLVFPTPILWRLVIQITVDIASDGLVWKSGKKFNITLSVPQMWTFAVVLVHSDSTQRDKILIVFHCRSSLHPRLLNCRWHSVWWCKLRFLPHRWFWPDFAVSPTERILGLVWQPGLQAVLWSASESASLLQREQGLLWRTQRL